MCNIYMFALAYLSWPVRTYLKEYEIEENEPNAQPEQRVSVINGGELELEDVGAGQREAINEN